MNTIERLENWRNVHKSRSVEIAIDNGYGASCWKVILHAGKQTIEAWECSFLEFDRAKVPLRIVIVKTEKDDDWPGLERTINAAIDRAEAFGFVGAAARHSWRGNSERET